MRAPEARAGLPNEVLRKYFPVHISCNSSIYSHFQLACPVRVSARTAIMFVIVSIYSLLWVLWP
jgi:hypothetical protein